MRRVLERSKDFIKKETVFSVGFILAVLSCFFNMPSAEYISFIDFRTLGILFSLMVVIKGFQHANLFSMTGMRMLSYVNSPRSIYYILVSLTFFTSMLMTNEIAIITFVPFAIEILLLSDQRKLIVYTVTLQTIGAVMGSMMSPIGNAQNLYIFNLSQMKLSEFVANMLPYAGLGLALLIIFGLFISNGVTEVETKTEFPQIHKKHTLIFALLFVLCILAVLKIVPYYVALIVVCAVAGTTDFSVFKEVNYMLLLTFVVLFIFVGNVGSVEGIHRVLENLVEGNEVYAGVIVSQFTSNLPATLLLSKFTGNYADLIIGIDLGGLGTLIASMTSIISFGIVAKYFPEKRIKYIRTFTGCGICFLSLTLLLNMIIG